MPHQGQKESRRLPECNAESLKQCMQRLFDAKTFHDIKIKFADPFTWTPETLAAASLFWTWSDDLTLNKPSRQAMTMGNVNAAHAPRRSDARATRKSSPAHSCG